MKTISEILGNPLDRKSNQIPTKRGGFFDLPKSETCKDPEHSPPSHICIPQGKGYRHICPRCGNEVVIIPPQVSL